MAPLTVGWLKLPLFAGVLIIVGVVRKEFVLVTLASFVGTDLTLALNSLFWYWLECYTCLAYQLSVY